MFGFGKKKEPVYVENELGKFKLVENHSKVKRDTMSRSPQLSRRQDVGDQSGRGDGKKVPFVYRYYDGDAVWHGAASAISAMVHCNIDPTGEAGFKRLAWAVENSAELEQRLIDYTVNDFSPDGSPVEIWSYPDDDEEHDDEEPDAMPPEEFKKHLSLNFICVEDDETISVEVDVDGLFTDHGFMITIDENGNITHGELWG